jgi:hypothetical protein
MKQIQSMSFERGSTLFLKAAVWAIGLTVLGLCIIALPAMWMAVPGEYTADLQPILYWIMALMELAALPFFYALLLALRILGHIDRNKVFSVPTADALKGIGFCAFGISIIYAVCLPFFYLWADKADAPGLVIVGGILMLAPLTIAVCAGVAQRVLREAVAIKSENDLTV